MRASGDLILAVTPWVLLVIGVHAQAQPNLPLLGANQPIPNFSGVGADLQFWQAINDRLYDVQPIAPTIAKLAIADLPTEHDGALVYCTNCAKTVLNAAGAGGMRAQKAAGVWDCATSCGDGGITGTSQGGPLALDLAGGSHKGSGFANGVAATDRATVRQLAGGTGGSRGGSAGCFNPVTYGADTTGNLAFDNGPAFTAAFVAACATNATATGYVAPVCIPVGTFSFFSPWLAMCPSTHAVAQTPDILGQGKTASVLINFMGPLPLGGGPLLEYAAPFVVSSFGGSATLIAPGLTGSGGNSFNWGPSSGPPAAVFNIDHVLGDQALNGKAQLDVRAIFNTTTNTAVEYLVTSDGSATPIASQCDFGNGPNSTSTCKGAISLGLGKDGKLYGAINTSVTGWTGPASLKSAGAMGTNATVYAELSYDGSNVRLFHGSLGGTSTMDAKVAQTGTIKQRTDENLLLGARTQYWNMMGPTAFWHGKIDSVEISTVARCTNDSGCSIPNAKIVFDANTKFGENWTNISNLPLVKPEYVTGAATDTGVHQSWMSMYNLGAGNPAGNSPTLRDFAVRGGQIGMHFNAVAPHLQRIDMTQGGPNYGIMLDQINDYGATIDDMQLADNVLPISIVGGITFVTRTGITCGIACMELVGTSVRDAILLPPPRTQWGIILSSGAHLDDIILDTENGGRFTVIQMSNMGNTSPPSLELSSSEVQSWGASEPPITVDGQYQSITITNSQLLHGQGRTGPFIGLSKAQQSSTNTSGINFINDTYDGKAAPSDIAGNSYVSATDSLGNTVLYEVTGGASTRQTTLAGTTAGTFVWSMPGEGSSFKRFVGHYAGYNNTSATPQTVTYPVPFTARPKITSNDGPSGSTSATTLSLPASMATPVSGWINVEGY